jgi:uncharacterized protein (TIGR00106 family)
LRPGRAGRRIPEVSFLANPKTIYREVAENAKKDKRPKIFEVLNSFSATFAPSRWNLCCKEVSMKVIADLCVVPMGVGVSVSEYVAACEKVLKEAGLKTQLHAYGTNIEGEWDRVFEAIKKCHEAVHQMGAPRISTTLKFGTRTDRVQTMEEKVKSVEKRLD